MKVIADLPRQAGKGEWVGLDIELFGASKEKLHRPTGSFACLSIAYEDGCVYQIYDKADIGKALARLRYGRWVFMDATFDIFHIRRWAKLEQRQVWDVMLVDRCLYGGHYDSFGLDSLSRRWLGKHLNKEVRDSFTSATEMTPAMREYAARDAYTSVLVAKAQERHLRETDNSLACYFFVDEPALWAVLAMPGVKVDEAAWLSLADEMSRKAEAVKNTLGFNPGSPKQVQDALMKVGNVRATLRRKETTAAEALENLLVKAREQGKERLSLLLESILEYRTYAKLATTYGRSWLEKHVEDDGLVYPSFSVTGARTGRTSSSSPNLQNIPVREYPQYRKCFISQHKSGRLLVSDVSQQEPRIAAWITRDKRLLEAVNSGDVYTPIAKDLGTTRQRAKVVFLALSYGMRAETLASREKLDIDVAKGFFEKFFSLYPSIPSWMDRQYRQASSLGYVETPMGRRIWVNYYAPQWQNVAVNGPIQGGAADMTKIALAVTKREADTLGLPFCTNIMVHDETVSDVPREFVGQYRKIVQEAWHEAGQKVIPGVPVHVEMYEGTSWGAKK